MTDFGRASLILRIGRIALWLAVTAGVAWFVAQQVAGGDDSNSIQAPSVQPISVMDRQTAMLSPRSIQPILSGSGVVVEDEGRFILEAPVTSQAIVYQMVSTPHSVKALIHEGPAGFDCAWLGFGPGADGRVAMRCVIPDDITVVAGLTGTMAVALQPPLETSALPLGAVVGRAQQGQVVVISDAGQLEVRAVQLGISDNFWIEITGGLGEDERVLASPVQADFIQGSP